MLSFQNNVNTGIFYASFLGNLKVLLFQEQNSGKVPGCSFQIKTKILTEKFYNSKSVLRRTCGVNVELPIQTLFKIHKIREFSE